MPFTMHALVLSCVVSVVLCSEIGNRDDTPAENEPTSVLDYYSMPALTELDDYDLCLRNPEAVYCLLDMELVKDETPLYQFIKNYSDSSYMNYKHYKLTRGVCASQHCGVSFTHANVTQLTASALKECLNASMHRGYGLQVESLSVRYCKTQRDDIPLDAMDYLIGVMLLLILFVNMGCSAYYHLKPHEIGEGNKFMLAFCIQKNWSALKEGGITEGGVFKCFQALRFYAMVIIIALHTMWFLCYGYTANPEFIENSYNNMFRLAFFNIRVFVQVFFVMSGFLMAYKMLVYAETHPFSLKIVPKEIFNRWFRLMPPVLVVMGLNMTLVPRLGSGPVWDAVVKIERDMCRSNWWQLVILMPSLFPVENLCLPQTWHLGTDTQLFLVTLVILLIIWRWPKSGVPILTFVMGISLLIPFLQSYMMELLPIRVGLFPESIRVNFRDNDTFSYAYISAQGNWASYHLGVLTAYFYHKAQSEKWNLRYSRLLKLLFIASIPSAWYAVFMGWDLHNRETTAFEAAVFNVSNQNFFALSICVFIVGCFYKANKVYVGAVEWGPLQPLGRMSYCAMLVHTALLRMNTGQIRTPIYASEFTTAMLFAGIVCTTYLIALPLYLFVEAPFCQLQKLLIGSRRRSKEAQYQR